MPQTDVELHVLAGIVGLATFSQLKAKGISEESFEVYPVVWRFIEEYAEEFKKTPPLTLLSEKFVLTFPTTTDVDFYSHELKKGETKRAIYSIVEQGAEFLGGDAPEEAIEFYIRELAKLRRCGLITSNRTDRNALKRLETYKQRMRAVKSGISIGLQTGLSFIDDDMIGLVPGNLVGIMGNTSAGKSWLLEYISVAAYVKNSARVLFVSPEMTLYEVEARWDTLVARFLGMEISNLGLIRGRGVNPYTYKEFLEQASRRNDWLTYETSDEGKAFSVPIIEGIASQFKPDLIAIDGLSLMGSAYRRAQLWEKLSDIVYDLKNLAKVGGYVVLLTNQATREAESRETPLLSDSGNVYDFVRGCDQVISMARPKDGREDVRIVRLAKRRVGLDMAKPVEIPWDVDVGAIG